MRITKLSLKLFIILILLLGITNPTNSIDNDKSNSNDGNSPIGLEPSQILGHPEATELNASIVSITRNITIKPSSRIIFEDQIELQIYDNQSRISKLNYTIPTIFDQFVQKVEFWSKFNTANAIRTDSSKKEFTKYQGKDATTYYIDITENNTRANETLNGVYISIRMEAIGAIKFDTFGEDQVGTFVSPVRPIFPNLFVDDSIIALKLEADQDVIVIDNITKINSGDRDWPISRNAGPTIIEWRNLTRDSFDDLEGLIENFDYAEISFISKTVAASEKSVTTVPFEVIKADRHLKIDPWGTVFVTETIVLLHTGAPRPENPTSIRRDYEIAGFNLVLDGKAVVTDVYDKLGTLNPSLRLKDSFYPRTTIDTTTGKQFFAINFRNTIYGGESYEFTVKYQFDSSEVITKSGSNYQLNTTLFSDFNTTVRHLKSSFELPAGAKLDDHSFKSRSQMSTLKINTNIERETLSFFRHFVITFELYNASFLDNYSFQIMYTYNGIGHFQFIITFMIITFLILSLVVILSRVKFVPSSSIDKTQERIPVDEIDSFFNLFSERSGASKRITELKERRKKGKVSKKEYDGQIKAIQRRVRELNPQLEKAAKILSDSGAKYERLVDKIMISSQKQRDGRTNMANARKSYRKGDTTKDIFQKIMREYTKDLTKQESLINRSLSELLELAQQYN